MILFADVDGDHLRSASRRTACDLRVTDNVAQLLATSCATSLRSALVEQAREFRLVVANRRHHLRIGSAELREQLWQQLRIVAGLKAIQAVLIAVPRSTYQISQRNELLVITQEIKRTSVCVVTSDSLLSRSL